MRRLGTALLAVSLLAGCGEAASEPSSESFQSVQAPLTETDVDVAPECEGILTFVNQASYETLDQYLPSDLVSNLVSRRTQAPFTSLADLNSVRLVGPARLEQIESGARTLDYIDADCAGIMNDLAVSHSDAQRIVALVNSVSSTEMHDILPYAWNGATNLLNLRPFTSAQAIADTTWVGSVSFRNLRNAATLSQPLEQLIRAVNALPERHGGAQLARHFDWWHTVTNEGRYQYGGLECFGIDPDSLPQGAVIRQNLATAAEVHAEVENTVNYAKNAGPLSQSVIDAGMANLDARIAGRSFKGCYFSYANDPWSGNNVAFFVDTVNGFSVMTKTYWVE